MFLLPRQSLFVSAALLALSAPLAASAQPAAPAANGWGVPLTDVPPDPAIRYGTLPNGMKYAVVRNAVPKGAAAVRLRFEFGSLGESERERGLAHFIEHMVFNGSTRVPEGEMIKILERQGLKFGPDTNAATGFDTTTYMLDLPQTDAERVDTALMLMREIASEAKFDPAAIDRERGVILGERRVRDTYQMHQIIDQIGFQVPDAPYGERLPIGTEEVLKTASAATMRDLYRRYYRPENATLVFVGDADPAAIERKIVAAFANWKPAGASGSSLPRGKVDLKRSTDFDTFVDPAVATAVTLTSFRPWAEPADTLAERRAGVLRALAMGMFNRRIARLTTRPGSILLGGRMSENDLEDAALGISFSVAAKDGAWKDALTAAEQELRSALLHGFNASELRVELADTRGRFKTAAEQADARTHQAIANSILGTVGDPAFVTTPAFRAAWMEKQAPTITLDEVNRALRTMWSGSQPLVHVSARQAISEAELATAFDDSRKQAVAAPKPDAAIAFAYQSFGQPGQVVEDRTVADLGIRTVRFANNVRLNIKRTDFEKGKVAFAVRLAGGASALPRDKPGLAAMLSSLSGLSATAKHSLDDIRTLSAGHLVTPGATVHTEAMVASGQTSATDLPLQMKISAAYLTDPGYRQEAADQWRNLVPLLDKQVASSPGSLFGMRVPAILAGDDYRFGLPPGEVLAKRSLAEAKAVLAPMVASAPIEIGIVGDVDEAAAIKAVAESFGALPARAAQEMIVQGARSASFRADRSPILLTHGGGADQALVAAVWPTDDDDDYRREVAMAMLAQLMDLMLTEEVRERTGASYGVSVGSTMSDIYDGFGYVSASSVVAPDKTDEVDAAIATVAKSLRDAPVADDLLARARAPMLETAAKARRQNGYWLSYVDKAQGRAGRLDRLRQQEQILRSITAAELQALARAYLTADRLQRVRIVSDKAPGAAAPTPVAKR